MFKNQSLIRDVNVLFSISDRENQKLRISINSMILCIKVDVQPIKNLTTNYITKHKYSPRQKACTQPVSN